jgi:hypothetical protein
LAASARVPAHVTPYAPDEVYLSREASAERLKVAYDLIPAAPDLGDLIAAQPAAAETPRPHEVHALEDAWQNIGLEQGAAPHGRGERDLAHGERVAGESLDLSALFDEMNTAHARTAEPRFESAPPSAMTPDPSTWLTDHTPWPGTAQGDDALADMAARTAAMIAADQETARIAAEQEVERIAAEQEARRIATEREAKRIAAEQEARRVAAEKEARRIAAEKEAARIAAEKEARRVAAEKEAKRIAAEKEARRVAAEREARRIAAEKEAARIAAEQEAARVAAE